MTNKLLKALLRNGRRSLFVRLLIVLLLVLALQASLLFYIQQGNQSSVIDKEFNLAGRERFEPMKRLSSLLIESIENETISYATRQSMLSVTEAVSKNDILSRMENGSYDLLDYFSKLCCVDSIYVLYGQTAMVKKSGESIHFLGYISPQQWDKLMKLKPDKGKWLIRDSENVLGNYELRGQTFATLFQPLPTVGDTMEGAIVVNFQPDSLFQTPIQLKPHEQAWVSAPYNTGIFSMKDGSKLPLKIESQILTTIQENKKLLIFNETPDLNYHYLTTLMGNQWGYIYASRADQLSAKSGLKSAYVLLPILFTLCLGVCAIFLFLRAYQPVVNAVKLLRKEALHSDDDDEFASLVSAIQRMHEQRRTLETQLESHLPVLRESILQSFLLDPSVEESDYIQKLKEIGSEWSVYGTMTFVIRIDDTPKFHNQYKSSDQRLLIFFITKFAEELVSDSFRMYSLDLRFDNKPRDIVVICNSYSNLDMNAARAFMSDVVTRLMDMLNKYLNFSVSIGIGDVAPMLRDVPESFRQAQYALEMRSFRGKGQISFHWQVNREQSPADGRLYELGKTIEKKLLTTMDMSDLSELDALLEQIKHALMQVEDFPLSQLQHMFWGWLSMVLLHARDFGFQLEAADRSTIREYMLTLSAFDDLLKWFEQNMKSIIRNIQEHGAQEGRSGLHPYVRQMENYIKANFDKDISLNGIAERLGIDPSYASRLFKTQTGINFMDFIIRERIKKAKLLLLDHKLSINEIAQQVGYTNTQSFIRVFKKHVGITPGMYRENHLSERLESDQVY